MREIGKRKRNEKEEREIPLKFSISSHPGCQDSTINATLKDINTDIAERNMTQEVKKFYLSKWNQFYLDLH